MLSTLPKLADRNFVLGFFVPTLLFSLISIFLFSDVKPMNTWFDALTAKDIGKAAYVLLAVWVGAVAMTMANQPLYRFLEGYTLPGWLARPLKERNQRRLDRDLTETKSLFDREIREGDDFPAKDSQRYDVLKQRLVSTMPSRLDEVLPTAFGNAIKAFEVYPRDVYGADGIPIWLRLGPVMSKEFAGQIQDARTEVDFLINSCFFSAVTAIIGIVRFIHSGNWQLVDSRRGLLRVFTTLEYLWLSWGVGGLILSYLFYRWAVSRVPAWGELVMTAFDCYLPQLAKQLGYELPSTSADRESGPCLGTWRAPKYCGGRSAFVEEAGRRRDKMRRPYARGRRAHRSGLYRAWVKCKNAAAGAVQRERGAGWNR
jgi:hypothetical protein